MNRYQFCTKYGWSFKSNMPDRYIKRKGIIFERIAEKGDTDQVAKLQKENRQLTEKVERLDGEYKKVREALEFIMSVVECMDTRLCVEWTDLRRDDIGRKIGCNDLSGWWLACTQDRGIDVRRQAHSRSYLSLRLT